MRRDDPYIQRTVPKGHNQQALKIFTLENLIGRVTALKAFRREIKQFLDMIH